MKNIEENYDKKGNATHYDSERINANNIFEYTYGTLAIMYFCEINVLKYRMRIGKKTSQSLEQEILKIKWYEKAAAFYFNKIKDGDTIHGIDKINDILITEHRLPWEQKK